MRLPLTMAALVVAAAFSGCVVPENMTALREELGYASVELPDVVVRARASTVEPRVQQPVAFNAVVEGIDLAAATVAWDLGDGTTADGPTLTHAYADPGDYPVVLTVTAADAPTATDHLTLTVRENHAPSPVITVEGRDALVEGRMAVLTATASRDADGDVLTYAWEIDGGDPVAGERVERAFEAGVHRVRLTASDGLATVVAFDSFAVALPLSLEGELSATTGARSLSFEVGPGARALSAVLTHTTTAGFDDVDLVLVDATGNVIEQATGAPEPLAATGTATLEVSSDQLPPGAYTLEARLTRGAGASVTIEGVLTYSPLSRPPV